MALPATIRDRLLLLQNPVEQDLLGNILPFWFRLKTKTGFLGGLFNDLTLATRVPVSLVMVSRILWTYSRAYRKIGDPQFKEFAGEVFQFLTRAFLDKQNGGYAWWLSPEGAILDSKKQTYGQAFVVYALSEYFMATGERDSLVLAWDLFDKIEEHCWREDCSGYWEALDSEWGALGDVRLSDKDLNAPLSMNTHLHIMEAYANLMLADRRQSIVCAGRKILDVVIKRILHPDGNRFGLFYDADWNRMTDAVSPGHDIEGSWLVWEMAGFLGDAEQLQQLRPLVLEMVDRVLREGCHSNGSIAIEYEPGSRPGTATDWWPQAEGVVGFLNAYQMTLDEQYLCACERTWAYINKYIIDHVHGEWYAGRQVNGQPMEIEKAGPWKACYHNGRMGFEVIERIESILKE